MTNSPSPAMLSKEELARMRLWSMLEWDPDVDTELEANIARNQIEALFAHITALESRLQQDRSAICEYEDGSSVHWFGCTGGAHPLGEWGELTLEFVAADGSHRRREYRALDLESQAPKLPEDIEGLVGRLEDEAKWLDDPYHRKAHDGSTAQTLREASSAIRAMAREKADALNMIALTGDLDWPKDDTIAMRVRRSLDAYWAAKEELSALKREVAEAIEPFANTVKHDIGADETDHDTFRPMTSPYHRAPLLTVGNLRALSALHDKMGVENETL